MAYLPEAEAMSGTWIFDAAVAENFTSHARQHIPDYMSVLDDATLLAQKLCEPGDAILDVGCATGETLRRLHDAGFTNLTGVDSSAAMLAQCSARHARLELSDSFPSQHAPFRLVLANWTLHFIEPAKRIAYFEAIYDGLAAGGCLMLTEKCAHPAASSPSRPRKNSLALPRKTRCRTRGR